MQINRDIGQAPRTRKLGEKVAVIRGCIGCTSCAGLCRELIEAMTVPEYVLKEREA